MSKNIVLKLSLVKRAGNIKILHDFHKSNKYPFSVVEVEVEDISFLGSDEKLLRDFGLFEIFNKTRFKIHISDSITLFSSSFIAESSKVECSDIADDQLIFGELDFHNDAVEIDFWWIINSQIKFLMVTQNIIQADSGAFEITIPHDFLYDIRVNANFFIHPSRIKLKNQY